MVPIDLDSKQNLFSLRPQTEKAFFFILSLTKTQKQFWYKVDGCLARYSPRAKANNAIPCHTVRYDTIVMIALSQVQLRPKRWVIQVKCKFLGQFWAQKGPERPPETTLQCSQQKKQKTGRKSVFCLSKKTPKILARTWLRLKSESFFWP